MGNLTPGSFTPLLSHATARIGQVRTLMMSQPGGGNGTLSQPKPTPSTPYGCRPQSQSQ